MTLWIGGALLAALGSIFSNLGVNFQKYSFMLRQQKGKVSTKSYYTDPRWFGGLLMVIFGSIFDFAALGLAAQSIVAPIGSVTLVANIFFAHYWLKEQLSRSDVSGTALIFIGSTLAVMFGDHGEREWTLDDLLRLYYQPLFLSYAGLVVVSCSILYAFIRRIEPLKVKLVDEINHYNRAIEDQDHTEAQSRDRAIVELERQYKPYQKAHPILYCALSGTLGGCSILGGKITAELIRTSIAGDNQMGNPISYVFIVGMFCCIFSQIHFLAKALNFFDALLCVPIFQCFFIIVSTLGGATYFQELNEFSPAQAVFFPLGILLTLFGVYVLSRRKMSSGSHAREARTDQLNSLNESLNSSIDLEAIEPDQQSGYMRLEEGESKLSLRVISNYIGRNSILSSALPMPQREIDLDSSAIQESDYENATFDVDQLKDESGKTPIQMDVIYR